jgi:hypothetical protein
VHKLQLSDSVESSAQLYEADLRAFFGVADIQVPAFDAVFLGACMSVLQHFLALQFISIG